VYRLLFHYKNPNDFFVETSATFIPIDTNSNDATQTAEIALSSSQKEPTSTFINSVEKPFVLNPGHWQLKIATKKRLFLDYVVLVPGEYYTGSSLKGHINQPCNATENPDIPCIDLLYPPLQIASRVDASNNLDDFQTFDEDGAIRKLSRVPTNQLPAIIGQAASIPPEDRSRSVEVQLDVPSDGEYYLLLEYTNPSEVSFPMRVRGEQGQSGLPLSDSIVLISHCPYNFFCREIISKDGNRALLTLEKSPPQLLLTFIVPPKGEFGIAAVNLIKKEDWKDDYLKQVPVCIRKDGACIGIEYPLPANSIVTPASSGSNVNNTISGDKLPFEIENADEVKVMSLDEVQSTVDISGLVTNPGHYVFVVHYYNPDNAPLDVDVLFQNEHFGDINFPYCPTTTGCRAIIYDRQHPNQNYFHVNDKYSWSFYYNTKQRGPIYIDSISAVPLHTYTNTLLKQMPLNMAGDFYQHCSENNFKNAPENITDYCKEQVFSLTSEFNNGALPCGCNIRGSTDTCCEEYGGECKCKENVVGRTCDRCKPGHYGWPECKPCQCTRHEQCNEETGQVKTVYI
jgi:laminin alpha 3/5